jgi:hypothetical protein
LARHLFPFEKQKGRETVYQSVSTIKENKYKHVSELKTEKLNKTSLCSLVAK